MLDAQKQGQDATKEAGADTPSPSSADESDDAGAVEEKAKEASMEESEPEEIESGKTADVESVEALRAERDQALAERADLLDRFQRAQAEFENLRKQLFRDRDEARKYAAMETIRSLLPIADDFERALESPGLNDEVRKGLDLVRKAMFEVFTRAGLEPVETDGTFDPHVHEAVDRKMVESDDEDQKVLEVYQRGYLFKDRLLRPAMVKVAVKDS
jgi:molecular chaperone GrpE